MVALLNIPLPYMVIENVLDYFKPSELLPLRLVCSDWKKHLDYVRPTVNIRLVKIWQDSEDEYAPCNNRNCPRSKILKWLKISSQTGRTRDGTARKQFGLIVSKETTNDELHFESLQQLTNVLEINRIHVQDVKFTPELIEAMSKCTRSLAVQEMVLSNCDFDEVTSPHAEKLLSSFGTCLKVFDLRLGKGLHVIKHVIAIMPHYYPTLEFMAIKTAIQLSESTKVAYFNTDVSDFLPLSQRLHKLRLSGLGTTFHELMSVCERWQQSASPSNIAIYPYLLNTKSLDDRHIVFPDNITVLNRSTQCATFNVQHSTRRMLFIHGKIDIFRDPTTPPFKCHLDTNVNLRSFRPTPLNVVYRINNHPVERKHYYNYVQNGRIHKCTNELSVKVPKRFWVTVTPDKETMFAIVCSCCFTESVSNLNEFVVGPGETKKFRIDLDKSACKRVCVYGWVMNDDIRGLSPWIFIRSSPEFIHLCSTYLRFSPFRSGR